MRGLHPSALPGIGRLAAMVGLVLSLGVLVSARPQDSAWTIRFMPADGASIQRDVTEMTGNDYIPVGISYDNRQMWVLYVKDPDRRIIEWTVTTYADEAAMNADLAPRIAAGWFPAGFTPGAGRYWVLYQKGGYEPLAAEFASCAIENEAIRRTVEAAVARGLYPVGIDSVGNTLTILFLRCRGPAPANWRMGSFLIDAPDAAEDVNARLREGYAPFDILVAGRRVNVFYLKFPESGTGTSAEGFPASPSIRASAPAAASSASPPRPAVPARTGSLTLGPSSSLPPRQAGAGRAVTIEVTEPGHPLEGFRLAAPAGAYRAAVDWQVSHAPIAASSFAGVRPASRLVTVGNGGEYSERMIRVRIPAEVADDEFAMGFYYDAATGTLEGLPLVAADSRSVTVATRHFSSIFVGAIKTAILDRLVTTGDLDSRFRPGVDDWQFTNFGSYIEPGGHCAGQALSALWYFLRRPDGPSATLHGRYDRNGATPATPGIWQDDNLGYRFASMVQHRIDWNSKVNMLAYELAGVPDAVKFRAFAYAMHATGEPQEVGIFSDSGGHDMIVYRIKDNALYIADPNYPGATDRRIEYDPMRGRFRPYNSGANADAIAAGEGESYDTIAYAAKTATIDWRVIGTLWDDFRERRIGAGVFPAYQLLWKGAGDHLRPITDSMVVEERAIRIGARLAGNISTSSDFFRDGRKLPGGDVRLVPGRNEFGIAVKGRRGSRYVYVDYAPVTIFYNGLSIEPERLQGEANTEYAFEATMEDPPSGVTYEWRVNGVRQEASGPAPTLRFPAEGRYAVTATAHGSRGEWLGACTAVAVIRPGAPAPAARPATGRLAQLQRARSINLDLLLNAVEVTTRSWSSEREESPDALIPSSGSAPITWSGTSFSGSKVSSGRWTYTFTGTVSPDGSRILSLEFVEVSRQAGSVMTTRTVLRDLPLDWANADPAHKVAFRREEGAVWPHVASSTEVFEKTLTGGGWTRRSSTATRAGQEAKLLVEFCFFP